MSEPAAGATAQQPGAAEASASAAEHTEAAAASSYDAVPYSVHAFAQTRPDRLATVAALFGLESPDPQQCRVLELGCASGGNLIPMAAGNPQSRFVGIDLSARQIADGQAVLRELGLGNVELREGSILDIDDSLGQFDYVLAHGVYSWVPPAVQERILEICARNLSPRGVAYVSYNTYPGWHARGAVREMLWYHTQRFADPLTRIREARALLVFMARAMPGAGGAFGTLLRQELALLLATPDTYLLHEHLEEFNEPLYFHQFAQRAAACGLQYLGETQVGTMVAGRLGADTEKTLRQISPDLLHMEQYMDFLRNRMFRQTLLCHAEVRLERALRPEAVMRFHVSSSAKPVSAAPEVRSDGGEAFAGGSKQKLTTRDPLMKGAMVWLWERAPASAPFDAVLEAARERAGVASAPEQAMQLATRLLHCYVSQLVDFSLAPPKSCEQVSERPIASPYARLRARQGDRVTNLRLETVTMSEPTRLVLQHLDGRHDRAALESLVIEWLATLPKGAQGDSTAEPPSTAERSTATLPTAPPPAGPPPEERARHFVDQVLAGFARAALLVG